MVTGVAGNMGRLARDTIESAGDLTFAGGLARGDDLNALLDSAKPDILIDFTMRPMTQDAAARALRRGIRAVIGSSEWNARERSTLQGLCEASGGVALLVPNFAIGAVLMMRFAQEAARYLPSAEILEMHRAEKRDKPSGTAAATAERMKPFAGDVPIHSVRLPGLLAHQAVMLGGRGELLTIRHDALSREAFAGGILAALRGVSRLQPGLHTGLERVL